MVVTAKERTQEYREAALEARRALELMLKLEEKWEKAVKEEELRCSQKRLDEFAIARAFYREAEVA